MASLIGATLPATHSRNRLMHQAARAADVVEQVRKAQRAKPPNCWISEAAFIEQGAELQLQFYWIKP